MSAKRKNRAEKQHAANAANGKQRLAQAQAARASGSIGTEDYIWNAMQCYAAELRAGHKPGQRFA